MEFLTVLIVTVLVTLGTISLTWMYGKIQTDFSWKKYCLFMSGPIASVGIWMYFYDYKVGFLFLSGSIIGLLLEFALGFLYQNVFQRNLWIYDSKAYSLLGHTSLLTIPMWGCAAVVFWIIAVTVGL